MNISVPVIVITDEKLKNLDIKKGDTSFNDFIKRGKDSFESVARSPDDAVIILFSSGTTGTPKVIPWAADCFVRGANDARLHYQMSKDDVLCWPSNYGWMMGSHDLSASAINNGSLAVYEGDPNSKKFAEFILDTKVTRLGVVPELVAKIRKSAAFEGFTFPDIKYVMNTAAASNPDDMKYFMRFFPNARTIEYSGGTEIAGAINTNLPFSDHGVCEFNTLAFGTKAHFIPVDEKNKNIVSLNIVISDKDGYLPPMGLSRRLLNKDHDKEYFIFEKEDEAGNVIFKAPVLNDKGEFIRKHGDNIDLKGKIISGDVTSIDGLRFTSEGRSDDIINVKGNKKGADILENWVREGIKEKKSKEYIKDIAIFQTKPQFGNKIIYYIQLETGLEAGKIRDIVYKEARDAVKNKDPLFAVIDELVFVDKIARNGSKIQRKLMKKEYESSVTGRGGV
jgi:acetyl-CoA synthetase